MKRAYSQIDLDERRKIERWRHAGVTVDGHCRETRPLIGAPVVELHTGTYAENDGAAAELARLAAAAERAAQTGIECHAGHGLTFENVAPVAALAPVAGLNIGHYPVGEALFSGLPFVIAHMKELIARARQP